MREYKISKGWAIFIYIAAPFMIALFGWILIIPFVPSMKNDMNSNTYWFLIPMSLGMIALMVVGVLDTINGKFVIDGSRVFSISTFSNRELMYNEIKGYRLTDKYIFIEPIDENKKKIKISTYFGKTDEIVEWLSDNYADLDLVQAEIETEEILNNDDYGYSKEEREDELSKARNAAKMLNWTGGLLFAWTIFFPNPYEYSIILSIVFPIICLIALKYFKGLIRIDERKDTAYPSIFLAIFISSLGLCLRALIDYNIFNYRNVWVPSIIILILYMGFLVIIRRKFKLLESKDYLTIAGFSIFMFGYSYGVVITLNCLYDNSQSEKFNATILNKRKSTGKTTTYYFELTPWGERKEIDEVSIPRNLYNKLDTNDNVNIYFMKGRFDIPWFEISE